MPSAREWAGAAAAGDKIYVIGGYDGKKALALNEVFSPFTDNPQDSWSEAERLPETRYAFGVASVADTIYVIGGEGDPNQTLKPIQFLHQQNKWQYFESPFTGNWSHLGLVPIQTELYGVGGRTNNVPAAKNLSYQAIYTILIPLLP